MADINLLPEVSEAEVKRAGLTRRVNTSAILALLIVAAILFGLFAYWFYLFTAGERISAQTKQAEDEISSQSRKEITRRGLVEKLNEADKFLKESPTHSISLDNLLDILTVSKANLVSSQAKIGGDMNITGEIGSSADFSVLVDQMTTEERQKLFGDIELVSLVKEENKPFTFNFDFEFLKKESDKLEQ